jgi:histidinol-phosphate phosphatase family protein
MAYRREAFVRAGGFDERFPRAYREDSDLGLRVVRCGGTIVQGERWAHHPPTAVNGWASVRKQRGNADDALMLLLHGPGWHERAGAPRGTRRRHLVTTALFASGVLAAALGRRRPAFVAGAAWGALTARLAVERREVASSVAIPFAATWWWLAGLARAWRLTRPPRAVLFDRDGTLVEDVPYNGDPTAVMPVPGARAALDRLRGAGVRVAMVTNQSGVARGFITEEQVRAVNGQVEQLLGPFDATLACMHGPDDDCACRKPRPGLVIEAATRLGVRPADCVVIGDIEADVMAAQSAGARGVLVPNAATLADEVTRAKEVAFDLQQAVDRLLARST